MLDLSCCDPAHLMRYIIYICKRQICLCRDNKVVQKGKSPRVNFLVHLQQILTETG